MRYPEVRTGPIAQRERRHMLIDMAIREAITQLLALGHAAARRLTGVPMRLIENLPLRLALKSKRV